MIGEVFLRFTLFQIYRTFITILQLDGDNFFDFCGEGGGEFFLLHFPLAVEGLGGEFYFV